MALRPSNRKRNAWAVSLMDVQPSDRILEIGFGPGIAIREIARRATRGQVVGIDRSAVMRAQAARRNASAIRAGRVSLIIASIDDPPTFEHRFDKVLAVNNMVMSSEPALRLKELAGTAATRSSVLPSSSGSSGLTTVTDVSVDLGDSRQSNMRPPIAP